MSKRRKTNLTPLEEGEGSKKKPKKWMVCDIESASWTKFLVIGAYDGETFTYYRRLRKFLAYLFTQDEDLVCFAHFGGIFDFMFLLQEIFQVPGLRVENIIPRGSGILCFDVIDDASGITVTFSDSSAFLPFGLDSLCKNFKVEHPKMKLDHEKTTRLTRKIVNYLRHDCMGLFEVIERYREWDLIKKSGPKSTMASQAMQVLRLFLKDPIYGLGDQADAFVRGSYFGGRTEIFRPLFISSETAELIRCWDVNSLYPTVMRENSFPNKFLGFTEFYDPKAMGFFDATVEVPESMYCPPLGIVHEGKFIFPTGTFSGRWSTIELEYARSLGVKILKTGKGAVFASGGKIFSNFVDELYKIRKEAKKNGDTVSDILAKLLMNSCYGRFGLNKDRENLIPDTGQLGVKESTIDIHLPNGKVMQLMKEAKRLDESFSNVAVAAWVTSLSRIYMHKIYSGILDSLYYTDTDSLFTPEVFENSEELGGLKLEYAAREACFLLPKTYLIDGIMDSIPKLNAGFHTFKCVDCKVEWEVPRREDCERCPECNFKNIKILDKKIVMKGFDRKKIARFEIEDFVTALEGELRALNQGMLGRFSAVKRCRGTLLLIPLTRLQRRNLIRFYDKKVIWHPGLRCYIDRKFARLKTALRKGKLVTMADATSREIRQEYDKRKLFRESDGAWNSRPIFLVDGLDPTDPLYLLKREIASQKKAAA